MEHQASIQILEHIAAALQEAGYDPHAQLSGYLQSGNLSYITRHNGARELIQQLDMEVIRRYLRCTTTDPTQ